MDGITDFAKLLNPEQFAAATAGDGPVLVLAAAGTGKTRTLVHRVAFLLEKGVSAERIMLLTFTNRAAGEMLSRARVLVGEEAVRGIWSGTFHSICARLLRRFGSPLGYRSDFKIIDEEDQKKLVGEIIKATVAELKDFPKKETVLKMISEAANEGKTVRMVASRYLTKVTGFTVEQIEDIALKYEARKQELGAMDFDDLLVNGLKLLKDERTLAARELLQERFEYVLVDEYQDTNALQAEFTDILAARHRNIMVVGDDFQCIYTWRGAQIENILDFPQRWMGCRTIKLERNYRSVPEILSVANVVMKDAPGQFEKRLRAYRDGCGEKPTLLQVYDSKSQAQEIYRMIVSAREQGYRYGDMAVLYRSHFQSFDIQVMLTRMQVPFNITSGVGVFELKHVKDVLAYLRLLVDPTDELSFLRFVALLPGVGEKSAMKYFKALGRKFNPTAATDREALGEMLSVKARTVYPAVAAAMVEAATHLAEDEIGAIIGEFVTSFYERVLREAEKENGETEERLDDLKEIAAQITAAEVPEGEGGTPGARRLTAFLADVALLTNLDARKNIPDGDKLTLSTVHQAKGMEWAVVFLPWLAEGMFPSAKATEENRIDEERRLFYVAVTRAKDALSLVAPLMRKSPEGGQFPVEKSMFVREIPPAMLNCRRVITLPPSGGYGGYSRGGYGYGQSRRGPMPPPVYTTTWRR